MRPRGVSRFMHKHVVCNEPKCRFFQLGKWQGPDKFFVVQGYVGTLWRTFMSVYLDKAPNVEAS